jgi:phytoene dehydrogenase-like protein
MTRVAAALAPLLTQAPPGISARPADLLSLFQTGRRVHRLDDDARQLLRWLPMSVFDFTHEWFADERLRACIAARTLSGSMSAPRSGWSTLLLLLREAHEYLSGGRPLRAAGGPGACTQAMASAARTAGAELRTDTAVVRILTADHRVTAVVTATGETIAADCVVSTLDPRTTLLGLVDRAVLPAEVVERLTHYRASGTLAKVTLALESLPRFRDVDDSRLLSGRIQIGDRLDVLERAFDAVKYGEPSPTPWLEMQIPSLLDPGLAPSGAHVASIYVHNAPYTGRSDGAETEHQRLLERTLAIVEEHAPGFSARVLEATVATPLDFESALGIAGGQIFHGELAPDQLLALRPVLGLGRYRTPVRGLYLGGAGTHPGGFMTGSSGRLAAESVLRN